MTQSEFIEKVNQIAGITFRNATLSSWENGQSSPTGDLIPVIAQILKTPVTHLFSDEEAIITEEINPDTLVGEPQESYGAGANVELYKRIFDESPQEAFDELLTRYEDLLKAYEKMRSEKQKLEGKLTASAEILKQFIDNRK